MKERLLLKTCIKHARARGCFLAAASLALFCSAGCGINSAKSHYVLAEKLWTDGKYAAAVVEFEKVTARDPRGKLGLQALFRAASTQAFFNNQYPDAVKKFRRLQEISPEPAVAWEAGKVAGDLLFTRLEQYDQAILQYESLLKLNPKAAEAPEFLFRVGKSEFYLWKFDDALKTYADLERQYPASAWAEKADFENGVVYFTRGEQLSSSSRTFGETYRKAIDAYQGFLKRYPKSELVVQARFGIANCLEELEQLDAAYQAYEAIRDTYPSRNVIEIKLARLRERKAQRTSR